MVKDNREDGRVLVPELEWELHQLVVGYVRDGDYYEAGQVVGVMEMLGLVSCRDD